MSRSDSDPIVELRTRTCRKAAELYITARPRGAANVQAQAAAMLEAVAATLRQHKASILMERIFATPAGCKAVAKARGKVFGDLVDAVEPTWLGVPKNSCGAISGMLVHAVAGCGRPSVLGIDGRPRGRLLKAGESTYVVGCNLQADAPAAPTGEAQAMLAKAEALLAQAGGSLADVPRTWMWLGGIVDWYGEFNRVRSELFTARGLLSGARGLPASTGIGIGPAARRHCAMDFAAVIGGQPLQFLATTSHQGAAAKYGSAFSRAAVAPSPAGRTIYVSGTAAIDAAGNTTHIGDPDGQIDDTLAAVQAVLEQAGGTREDIVQAIVYCKTPQVEQAFRRRGCALPNVLAIADVCRDSLLFEMEITAMPQSGEQA